MHAHLAWWLPDVVVLSVISGAVLGLRAGERDRMRGVVIWLVVSVAGAATVLVPVVRPGAVFPVFAGFVAVQLAVLVVSLVLDRRRSGGGSDAADWRDPATVSAYSFGLVAVATLTTRAYQAAWPPGSAATAFLGLVGLALFAVGAGVRSYTRRAEAQRRGVADALGNQRLLLALLTGFGMVAAAPVFVLLGRPLGFDIAGDARPAPGEWATGATIAATVAVAAVGVVVAAVTRPGPEVDDRLLRPRGLAVALVGAANAALVVLVVHDVLAHRPTWPLPVVLYVVLLAALVGVMYGEDLITTPVRLQLLRPGRRAWALTVLGGATAAALTVWMIERHLWVGPWRGVTFASAASTLAQFGLGLLCVVAIHFVLAMSSSKAQQVTVNSPAVNVVQGQPLYAFLAAATCWLPSVLLARFVPDVLQNIKPAIAFLALSWVLYRVYLYAHKMNAQHFADELTRTIPRLDRLAGDAAGSLRLHREFRARLRAHLDWQDKGTRVLFVASIVWLLVVVAATKGWLEEHLPAKREVLAPLPHVGEGGIG
ncbi:hypothetical protein AB0A74_22075 [Saccharothrix sp. NPDC042600]|uniref:hypothetical protein n=1 Tax=Saccharothrix TaxID=2071 RepID=UPI0033C54FF8|nr:hypothetical protein GCM10017745_53140 [Saccharothrix mutabilis subsp. capreolus]